MRKRRGNLDLSEVEELEANVFAMELLMPEEFLRRDLTELGSIDVCDDANIRKLAKRYEVSEQLMTFRIADLLRRK